MSRIATGLETCLYLGNLDSKRDWGHAKDYVEMQWLMLQQKTPKDYVISSGEQYSVRQFLIWCSEDLGLELEFRGEGDQEIAVVKSVPKQFSCSLKEGQIIVRVDPKYYRPAEVETLLGDAGMAKKELGWQPKITAREMCSEMMSHDLSQAMLEKNMSELGQ